MSAIIDTNVLIYAIDNSDKRKHEIAKKIVSTGFREGAYVPTQVVAEFYEIAKKKLKKDLPLGREIALAIIKSKNWIKLSYDEKTIWKTIEKDEDRGDFWDLLIYHTMIENEIFEIITENEKDFQYLDGITAINPFK